MMKKLMMLFVAVMATMGAWAAQFEGTELAQGHIFPPSDNLIWFNDAYENERWDGTHLFDEYMSVDGEKYSMVCESYFILLPVRMNFANEKITPVVINGTMRQGSVSVKVYSDREVFNKFKNSTNTHMLGLLDGWVDGRGVSDTRAWIWVSMNPGSEKIRVKCDVSKRPAAGVYSNMTMTEYAKKYGVDFSGIVDASVSTWFEVGIQETGEVFPTRFYCHRLIYDLTSATYNKWMKACALIDERGEYEGVKYASEAIVCPAAWYVSPKSAGAVEVVAKSTDIRMGMVSGGGVYYPGEKSILVGTPNKGYAFVGWYEDEACTKLFSAPGVDYTKATVNHTVVNYDQTLYAKFKPGEPEDGDGVEVLSSYGPFVPGSEVEINLGLVGYTAKKLPSGLKLDKKTGIVKGKAKKPGEYQVTFTKKGAETLTAKFIVGPMPTITITMEGDIEKCKVTGASKPGKGYLVGKKVSLSAKGPKGTAFTGWFKDGEPWPNETEYLESKLKYVMTEENLSLVAHFEKEKMSVACDGLSALTVGEEVSIPVAIETQSGVKSVKGSKLPSGLKIKKDKATGEWFVTGKPKKVGVWNATITVTAKSGAVEKLPVAVTVEDKGEVDLPSANHYFKEPLKNREGEKYVVSVGISNVEDFLPNLKLTRGSLDVSGLPEGLKYDGASGKITGIATKAGTYTVTLTVTDGKAKYVSTITLEVEALPDWAMGTFYGKEIARGVGYSEWVCPMQITATITSAGKITIKGIEPGGEGTYRVGQLAELRDDGSYAFTLHHVSGRKGKEDYTEGDLEGVITPMTFADNIEFGCLIMHDVGVCDEDDDPYESKGEVYQSLYSRKIPELGLPTLVKNAITTVDLGYYYGGYLTLKYGANGAVTTSYSETEGGKAMATGSAQLVPYEVNGNITKAWLYTALQSKGHDPFGVLFFLSIDTSNGNVYGDDVIVEDYLLEVEE